MGEPRPLSRRLLRVGEPLLRGSKLIRVRSKVVDPFKNADLGRIENRIAISDEPPQREQHWQPMQIGACGAQSDDERCHRT